MTPNAALRQNEAAAVNMVLCQLRTNGILDERLLGALMSVPREGFVPTALSGAAYADDDIHLGNNRYLIAPLTFCRMLKLADIQPQDRVLVIGAGMGFGAAVISRLCREVVACESEESFITAAKDALKSCAITNVQVEKVGKLCEGSAKGAPYDVIIIEGAVAEIPESLTGMLAPNGRLVTVLHTPQSQGLVQGHGRLTKCVMLDGAVYTQQEREEFLPLLPGCEAPPRFVF